MNNQFCNNVILFIDIMRIFRVANIYRAHYLFVYVMHNTVTLNSVRCGNVTFDFIGWCRQNNWPKFEPLY